MNTIARLAACLALLVAFVAPARASDPAPALPNRPPDFYVESEWASENNAWDLQTQSLSQNCATVRFRVPAAPPNTQAVITRQLHDYEYEAEVVTGASAVPAAAVGGSWNCAFIAHDPNIIGGPAATSADCPVAFQGLVSGTNAGDPNNFALWIVPNAVQHQVIRILETDDPLTAPLIYGPGAYPIGAMTAELEKYPWQVAKWKTANGYGEVKDLRDAKPKRVRFHELYMTPVSDPDIYLLPQPGYTFGAGYSHSMTYSLTMRSKTRLAGWYVKPADIAANPALLGL